MSPTLARTAGALAAAAPFAVALSPPPGASGLLAAATLVAGGLLLMRRFHLGRGLATGGVLAALWLGAPWLLGSPATALLALIAGMGVLAALWLPAAPPASLAVVADSALASGARAAAVVVLAGSVAVLGSGATRTSAAAVAAAWLIGAGLALAWRRRAGGSALVAGALAPGTAAWSAVALGALDARGALAAGALLPAAVLLLPEPPRERARAPWWEPILRDPARLLLASFAGLCAFGTLLLLLPAASASGRSLGLADAAFTAVSAACVTGLVVVDTGSALAGPGQAVVLLLIQLGGLGIMAFSAAALAALGVRISLHYEGAIAAVLGDRDRGQLARAMRRLLAFTFGVEAAGAALLTLLFLGDGEPLGSALWRGVFTAISAFCNAGFALQADSLGSYAGRPAVLHAVAALVILGGLSPAGAAGLLAAGRGRRAGLQVGLVLVTSAVLLVTGFAAVASLEWGHALRGLAPADRLHNAWFQSVTLRTAGFDSVPFGSLRPPTLAFAMVWMFVGGSPGSTAGGIKTTTAAVLLLAAVAAIRGREHASAFGRRIPHRSVYRAAAIATLGACSALLGVMALLLTQRIAPGPALFEVVSAIGTVGLSLGATADLDALGKVIVMGCMFMGRVGPLTAFVVLSRRRGESPGWRRPEESVDVG